VKYHFSSSETSIRRSSSRRRVLEFHRREVRFAERLEPTGVDEPVAAGELAGSVGRVRGETGEWRGTEGTPQVR